MNQFAADAGGAFVTLTRVDFSKAVWHNYNPYNGMNIFIRMMLRALTKSDLGQVLAIEESVQVTPWTEETFYTCFEAGYHGWVLDLHKKIIGFVIVSIRPTECHILNVCIARPYQHQGYGRQLMAHVLSTAKQQGVGIAYLEVRRSNTKAISLYKQMQFSLVGERQDYYPALVGKEDALVFAKDLQRS